MDAHPIIRVNTDELLLFIHSLKRAGFKVGSTQFIAAHDLIAALYAHPETVADGAHLRRLLGPIFCTSKKEQEDFVQHFKKWEDRLLTLSANPDRAVGLEKSGTHTTSFVEKLTQFEQKTQWYSWLSWALSLLLVLSLIVFSVFNTKVEEPATGSIIFSLPTDLDPSTASFSINGASINNIEDTLSYTADSLLFIRIEHPAYFPFENTVKVQADSLQILSYVLDKRPTGTIFFRSNPPSSRVRLGSMNRGTTPLELTDLTVGTYPVQLSSPGYETIFDTLVVEAENVLQKDYSLNQLLGGNLNITTSPTNAEVTIDMGAGAFAGITPQLIPNLLEGTYPISIEKEGYEPFMDRVRIRPDSTLDLFVSLQAIEQNIEDFSVRFNESGSILLTGDAEGELFQYDLVQEYVIRNPSEQADVIRDISDPNSSNAADTQPSINQELGSSRQLLDRQTSWHQGLNQMAVAQRDGKVSLWQTDINKKVQEWLLHVGTVNSVAFSSSGRFIATAGSDSVGWLIDNDLYKADSSTFASYQLVDFEKPLVKHHAALGDVSFSPDERWLAVISDYSILLFDVSAKEVIDTLFVPEPTAQAASASQASPLLSIDFSPDGKYLVSTNKNKEVLFWDLEETRIATVTNWIENKQWLFLLGLLLLVFPFLISYLQRRKNIEEFLKRERAQEEDDPEIQNIQLKGFERSLFDQLELFKVAQQLRRRINKPSNKIDQQLTVRETVHQGGIISPVFSSVQVYPEYLFLIDRATYHDQLARYVDDLVAYLKENEVITTRFYFDRDPRVCIPIKGTNQMPMTLKALSGQYPDHRMVLVTDAVGFFNSITGDAEPWIELFSEWKERFLLTPEHAEHWGYQEITLMGTFEIYPATPEGLVQISERNTQQGTHFPARRNARSPYPSLLLKRPQRWIERDPPTEHEASELLDEIEAYLGQDEYYLLKACAVYPEMRWTFTLNLAATLKNKDAQPLIKTVSLPTLVRLPWFRENYMPDWFRLILIMAMTREEEQSIRQVIEALLVTATQLGATRDNFEIARNHPESVHNIARDLLRRFRKSDKANENLKEHVFLSFMNGESREKLAVHLPAELRTQLNTRPNRSADQKNTGALYLSPSLKRTVAGAILLLLLISSFFAISPSPGTISVRQMIPADSFETNILDANLAVEPSLSVRPNEPVFSVLDSIMEATDEPQSREIVFQTDSIISGGPTTNLSLQPLLPPPTTTVQAYTDFKGSPYHRLDPEKVVLEAGERYYIGPRGPCGECHVEENSIMVRTPHFEGFDTMHPTASAQRILKRLDLNLAKAESVCLKCHYTSTEVNGRARAIAGVTCESCHGAARDWLEVHNDYGGYTHATEPPDHKAQRIQASVDAGMLHPSTNSYELAATCFECHTVPNEHLVNVGKHVTGSNFELVTWTDNIQHNFLEAQFSDDWEWSNRNPTYERNRVMYVVGRILDYEYNMRGLAVATEDGQYARSMERRITSAVRELEKITYVVSIPQVDEILTYHKNVTLRPNNRDSLLAIANHVRTLGRAFEQQYHGGQIVPIDQLIRGEKVLERPNVTFNIVGEKRTTPAWFTASDNLLRRANCALCHKQAAEWLQASQHANSASYIRSESVAAVRIATNYGLTTDDMKLSSQICMTCHGKTIEEDDETNTLSTVYGLACENCHGQGNYLELHHRISLPEAHKIGLKKLKDPAVLANNCATCHHITDERLLSSGHPSGAGFTIDARVLEEHIKHWPEDIVTRGRPYPEIDLESIQRALESIKFVRPIPDVPIAPNNPN